MSIHKEIARYIDLLSNARDIVANPFFSRRRTRDFNPDEMYETITESLELLYYAGYFIARDPTDDNIMQAELAVHRAKMIFRETRDTIPSCF